MGRTKEYLEKLEIAKQRFLSGEKVTDISRDLHMDMQILRNNLREFGYKDTNIDYEIFVDAFDKIKTEEQAYWLGMMCADGYVSSTDNHIELCLKEKEMIEKFKNFLNTRNKVCVKKVKINDRVKEYYRISIRNTKIHDDLIRCGCVPRKSLILKFPTEDIVPKHLINHFVRGYFDGDGCIHKYEYERSLIFSLCGTYEFLEEIKKIYDLPNNKYSMSGQILEYKTAEKDAVERFLGNIYSNSTIFLNRKKSVYERCRAS